LQYGNQWLLVIQSVDAIQDPAERMKRQARLVDVLTEKSWGHTAMSSGVSSARQNRETGSVAILVNHQKNWQALLVIPTNRAAPGKRPAGYGVSEGLAISHVTRIS
jgi:hypothetical protein